MVNKEASWLLVRQSMHREAAFYLQKASGRCVKKLIMKNYTNIKILSFSIYALVTIFSLLLTLRLEPKSSNFYTKIKCFYTILVETSF